MHAGNVELLYEGALVLIVRLLFRPKVCLIPAQAKGLGSYSSISSQAEGPPHSTPGFERSMFDVSSPNLQSSIFNLLPVQTVGAVRRPRLSLRCQQFIAASRS